MQSLEIGGHLSSVSGLGRMCPGMLCLLEATQEPTSSLRRAQPSLCATMQRSAALGPRRVGSECPHMSFRPIGRYLQPCRFACRDGVSGHCAR